jgi:hypothetical protein
MKSIIHRLSADCADFRRSSLPVLPKDVLKTYGEITIPARSAGMVISPMTFSMTPKQNQIGGNRRNLRIDRVFHGRSRDWFHLEP